MTSSPRYDWQAIEMDYRAGVLPLASICSKHNVSMSRLVSYAKEHGWQRMDPPTPEEVHGVASSGFIPTDSLPDYWSEEELKKAALLTAGQVLDLHRKDIAKLRDLCKTITERLGLYLFGTELKVPFKSDKESPSDILGKLTKVMAQLTQLERQAFGMSAIEMPGSDDAEVSLKDELAELEEQIANITKQKAGAEE